ncbi:MAG TPA: YdcF family protein [Gemmatimonadaceae bacterium]
MQEASESNAVARRALAGAVLGTFCAVSAHVLGVQQLLRRPELVLYAPAAIAGAILGATRLRPVLWIGAGVIALLCIAVAYTPLVSALAQPLIRRDSIPARVDAIAVLSAGFTPDGMMRSETLDRLLTGLALARRGLAPVVLVSRERKDFGGAPVSDSADLARVTALVGAATPTMFIDSVTTTRTEALRMRAIARTKGWKTLAVVTSPLHTRRACATFEAVGFKVVCVPATVRESGLYPGSIAEDRLRAFRSWLYETFATDSYRRRSWIPQSFTVGTPRTNRP